MSVASELSRIQTDRNKIRDKLVEMGLATGTDTLTKLAEAVAGLIDQGAVSVTIKEGDTYTIPKGYHNGSGTVSGVSGGGSYNLQSKTITPTKSQQNVTPDSGYYGMSDVTVKAIPDQYQDVSAVTVTADKVLVGEVFVTKDGTVTAGTMPVISGDTVIEMYVGEGDGLTEYVIPKGYHYGNQEIRIFADSKTVTPTKAKQTIYADEGRTLLNVVVEPIPADYITTTDANAKAAEILANKTAYVGGSKVTGTMKNNGATGGSIDGITTTSVTIPAGYTSGGTVSLTNDIEEALAAI